MRPLFALWTHPNKKTLLPLQNETISPQDRIFIREIDLISLSQWDLFFMSMMKPNLSTRRVSHRSWTSVWWWNSPEDKWHLLIAWGNLPANSLLEYSSPFNYVLPVIRPLSLSLLERLDTTFHFIYFCVQGWCRERIIKFKVL